MSGPSKPATKPAHTVADLVEYIAQGCKPPSDWRIGTEHEKLVFRRSDYRRPAYDDPDGIRAIFEGLQKYGWSPVEEAGYLVALLRPDGSSVTFEPGGQIELSGAPLCSVHETCSEVNSHLSEVKEVSERLGIGLIGLGFDPRWRREDIPWMPKRRYQLMREYMPTRGNLGLDMMIRTATVQVNLDFSSEADMVQKLRVSLALQPIATAIFANSPLHEGVPSGFSSYRSHVWTDTDPDRTGMLPFAFEDGMGFERYVDYALDVPMYFVYRDGTYLDARGQSFRSFLAGKLPALPGERPTIGDWTDHLSTIFPEVRLKRFLEQRGADGGPWKRLCALPALWVGLLYDQSALDAAWDLVRHWTAEERQAIRDQVPRDGFATPTPDGTVREVARRMLAISRAGLEARDRRDGSGRTESHFLDELDWVVASGESPAAQVLRVYEQAGGDLAAVYDELAY